MLFGTQRSESVSVRTQVKTENGEVVVSLWDTAGAERFESLSRLYYSGAEAAIICMDPTDAASFPKTQFWVRPFPMLQCLCLIFSLPVPFAMSK